MKYTLLISVLCLNTMVFAMQKRLDEILPLELWSAVGEYLPGTENFLLSELMRKMVLSHKTYSAIIHEYVKKKTLYPYEEIDIEGVLKRHFSTAKILTKDELHTHMQEAFVRYMRSNTLLNFRHYKLALDKFINDPLNERSALVRTFSLSSEKYNALINGNLESLTLLSDTVIRLYRDLVAEQLHIIDVASRYLEKKNLTHMYKNKELACSFSKYSGIAVPLFIGYNWLLLFDLIYPELHQNILARKFLFNSIVGFISAWIGICTSNTIVQANMKKSFIESHIYSIKKIEKFFVSEKEKLFNFLTILNEELKARRSA